MKKKLMMVTLLLAGLTMGACVDDKESASVTAVREAKTEQLEALAEMNNAAAQARQAMAAAEAALAKAEAEAKQAAAELRQAEAEIAKKQAELDALENEQKDIKNQELQAQLEKELAELEVHKKEVEQKLAQIDAAMQLAEIQAQENLIIAQQNLVLAEKAMVDYEKELALAKTQEEKARLEAEQQELQRLSRTYSLAVDNLNSAQSYLNQLRRDLVRAENDLISLEEGKDALIAQNESQIARKEMQIAKYKEYANYTEDMDALKSSYNKLQGDYNLAYDNSRAALNHWYELWSIETPETKLLDEEIENDKFYLFAIRRRYVVDEEGNTESLQYPISQYVPRLSNGRSWLYYEYEDENISNYREHIGDSLYFVRVELSTDIRRVEYEVNEQLSNLTSRLEQNQKDLKDYQNAYDGEATLGLYPYFEVVTDDQGVRSPSQVPCRNLKDSVAFLKNAYETETDATKKQQKRTAYENFLNNNYEATAQQQIETFTANVEDYTADIAQLKDQWEMYQKYDENIEALQTKIDARNKKQLEELAVKVEAFYNKAKADSQLEAVKAERNAIALILYGTTSNDDNISTPDGNYGELTGAEAIAAAIKTLEDEIAALKEQMEDFSAIASKEDLIARLKVQIEANEAIVKAREIAVENAKADLEAAMAKAAGTEEE